MTTTRKLAVVAAGVGAPSSTRLLADRLTQATVAIAKENGIEVEASIFELRDTAKDVTNNLITGFPTPKLASVIETVANADGLIAVTPVFNASFNGLFKSFFDVIDPSALSGQPVLIGATGGSPRHSLVLEYALRPLFAYLHADVLTTGVYAATEDWAGSSDDSLPSLPDRIDRAARSLARALETSDRSQHIKDPWELDSSFNVTGGFSAE
ncbi:FMN reductase [Gryllotalpicola sp.]|uniref:FMN reductase n=1 Tax=Gryllotalpicola sp. TaxID=1932787 RepID=UPI00261702ED|nr:FMN reductase [Gryllotalpicola sp.]